SREQELLTVNPQAQPYVKLEKERKAMDKFFREECGFASYEEAREKLDGRTVSQILRQLQISKEVIQSLKTDLAQQEKQIKQLQAQLNKPQARLSDQKYQNLVQQFKQVAQ